MEYLAPSRIHGEPWNKGKLVGQKRPLKLKEIWAIRVRLQLTQKTLRVSTLQPGHRQQATRLRPDPAARI